MKTQQKRPVKDAARRRKRRRAETPQTLTELPLAVGAEREANTPKQVVDLLNGEATADESLRKELRVWVDAWLDSDRDDRGIPSPHTGKMLAQMGWQDPERRKLLETPVPCVFMPRTDGKMWVLPMGNLPSPDAVPEDAARIVALNIFRQLVLHPDCELVCGPCPQCSAYFLKRGRYRTKYCPNCDSSKLAAKRITLDRQREELMYAIHLAREAVDLYVQTPKPPQKWWAFTLAHLKKNGHVRTASSLTRWVKNADRPTKVAANEYLILPPEIEALQSKSKKKGRPHA
jgi:hypothetical protein